MIREIELADRALFYNIAYEKWPDSHLHVETGRWISGTWILGQNYRARTKFYGAYPPGYLDRIEKLFPDAERTLHLFSGSLAGGGLRVDRRIDLSPDVCACAEALPLKDSSVDLVLADPPYTHADARRYGLPLPNKRRCIKEVARVLESGGYLVWLDTSLPMFSKKELQWVGAICLIRSTNHRVRLAAIFQRV